VVVVVVVVVTRACDVDPANARRGCEASGGAWAMAREEGIAESPVGGRRGL
jgi:hypothetical protein